MLANFLTTTGLVRTGAQSPAHLSTHLNFILVAGTTYFEHNYSAPLFYSNNKKKKLLMVFDKNE